MIENQPKITKSTPEEWVRWHESQAREANNQLSYVAEKLPHILRLSMERKDRDVVALFRMILRRLQYPRDKSALEAELLKHRELFDGPLRYE